MHTRPGTGALLADLVSDEHDLDALSQAGRLHAHGQPHPPRRHAHLPHPLHTRLPRFLLDALHGLPALGLQRARPGLRLQRLVDSAPGPDLRGLPRRTGGRRRRPRCLWGTLAAAACELRDLPRLLRLLHPRWHGKKLPIPIPYFLPYHTIRLLHPRWHGAHRNRRGRVPPPCLCAYVPAWGSSVSGPVLAAGVLVAGSPSAV